MIEPCGYHMARNRGQSPNDKVNPVWQVIFCLSRYPVFLTTEHPEHTEKEGLLFRVFGVFRGSLLFGDKSEYVHSQRLPCMS